MNYDPERLKLRIGYVSGMIYDYLNVPLEVYKEFKRARSKGIYLNKHIKGSYDFKKIEK